MAAMAHVPSTLNVWAPEIHWDDETDELVVVYASTVRAEHPEVRVSPALTEPASNTATTQ